MAFVFRRSGGLLDDRARGLDADGFERLFACARAVAWILSTRGREGHWLWRWKFRTSDQAVHLDPDKFGWPWIRGTTSWVIPTAFTLVALKQFTACARSDSSDSRIRTGVEMLLDRACPSGG